MSYITVQIAVFIANLGWKDVLYLVIVNLPGSIIEDPGKTVGDKAIA